MIKHGTIKYWQDRAEMRLELLKRCVYVYVDAPGGKYVCYFCSFDKGDGHADDCEWGKELANDL